MLDLVRSLKTLETNFNMYIDAPTKLSSFFFALDHTDYARWIPVRLRAMLNLTNKHPDMASAFAKRDVYSSENETCFCMYCDRSCS